MLDLSQTPEKSLCNGEGFYQIEDGVSKDLYWVNVLYDFGHILLLDNMPSFDDEMEKGVALFSYPNPILSGVDYEVVRATGVLFLDNK